MIMKIAIIGAGNIGGAIASGLMESGYSTQADIVVSDPEESKVKKLAADYPGLKGTSDNHEAVKGANIVIIAVKPWLVEPLLSSLELEENQILASVAAGVTFEKLAAYAGKSLAMFRIIPNTAIRMRASMSLIASMGATEEQEKLMLDIFDRLGLAMMIPESKMTAGTAVSSCGIAYVLKYIYAATEAGVEMGLYPHEAMMMVAQSAKGAAELLLSGDTHPAVEIDKVTTPGGLTIKGVNTLDAEGFAAAVIKAIKASV